MSEVNVNTVESGVGCYLASKSGRTFRYPQECYGGDQSRSRCKEFGNRIHPISMQSRPYENHNQTAAAPSDFPIKIDTEGVKVEDLAGLSRADFFKEVLPRLGF